MVRMCIHVNPMVHTQTSRITYCCATAAVPLNLHYTNHKNLNPSPNTLKMQFF